jgi:hypothetical protein
MGDPRDPSSYRVTPRIRYNTVGGVNGPLVILDNVSPRMPDSHEFPVLIALPGQIPAIQ